VPAFFLPENRAKAEATVKIRNRTHSKQLLWGSGSTKFHVPSAAPVIKILELGNEFASIHASLEY
jgi:hypothetical protein